MLKLSPGMQIHLLKEALADAERLHDAESVMLFSNLIQKLTGPSKKMS